MNESATRMFVNCFGVSGLQCYFFCVSRIDQYQYFFAFFSVFDLVTSYLIVYFSSEKMNFLLETWK